MADLRGPLDDYLVLRCQAGDRESFGQLVVRWHPRLLRHARRLIRDPDIAADALQESWIAIQRGLRRLADPSRFPVWALAIVSNKCTDQLRMKQRRLRNETAAMEHRSTLDESVNLQGATSDSQVIHEALATLDDAKRIVLELHYLEGLSVAEIATVLDVPSGTVKSRLHHARNQLARFLNRPSNHPHGEDS